MAPLRRLSLKEIMEDESDPAASSSDFSLHDWSAHAHNPQSEEERANEKLLRLFHTAMAANNVGVLKSLLADDLEWWFHGAPCQQYMRRLLTGRRSFRSITLAPMRMVAWCDKVFVDGCGPEQGTYWAHVWTIRGGRLVELREFWNIGVVLVRELASSSERRLCAVWESKLWNADMSTPGLILSI